jgi:plastocyanin
MNKLLMLIFLVIIPVSLYASSNNPPNGRTGAPGESTCLDCHGTYPLNSGDGELTIIGPESFEEGQTYEVIVELSDPDQLRWGFEITPLDLGTCHITDPINTVLGNSAGKSYVKQTSTGTYDNTLNGPVSWTFEWTAPSPAPDSVIFYAAGNAANSNNSTSGDYIYTTSFVSQKVTYDHLVNIGDFFFDPEIIHIEQGQTIRWINIGAITHTTTDTSGLIWDSGFLSSGEFFEFTFNDEGVFPYLCTLHPLSMTGTIIVGRPDSISVDIDIVDFDFIPNDITVNIGEYVRWINKGAIVHTTTDTSANLWDSGFLNPGEVFTYHADQAGDFNYICSLHPTTMTGILHVFDPNAGGCDYVVGDVNNSGGYNGLDVTYGVNYFKGGPPPPYECECTTGNSWFVAGDVNASCSYNGLDVTYGVSYLKGGPAPQPCADCPPN